MAIWIHFLPLGSASEHWAEGLADLSFIMTQEANDWTRGALGETGRAGARGAQDASSEGLTLRLRR